MVAGASWAACHPNCRGTPEVRQGALLSDRVEHVHQPGYRRPVAGGSLRLAADAGQLRGQLAASEPVRCMQEQRPADDNDLILAALGPGLRLEVVQERGREDVVVLDDSFSMICSRPNYALGTSHRPPFGHLQSGQETS